MVLCQAYDNLRMQICKLQSDNKLLNRELADIKSQMSCFNDAHSTKMNSIIQMQGVLKTDLMEIRTNMQFLSETMSAMISSSLEEIMRLFSKKVKDGGTEVHGVGDKGTHVARGCDKTDEGSTSPDGRSELPVKWVSRPTRILQSPFVVGKGKLFKYDDHVIVFEHFKGDVEEVDKSTFMIWFQRGFKPKNKYVQFVYI
ncbi:Hypothetical predicted protein [Olea europaea subsp. europaea]|uniref:Uncharacterized protein n=1 Tax=Olea europaea subsp. europaea TaxID=158383 RepID=A0A8S0UPX2_OLEEU|nr:Hypothetical predicted protein [Olea europaea subsp. europaea]